jgi:hypothetical protein
MYCKQTIDENIDKSKITDCKSKNKICQFKASKGGHSKHIAHLNCAKAAYEIEIFD